MSNVGRISGPLLKANLERKGVDLAFETDLLYLDVQGRFIGIRKKTPTVELEVTNSGIKTTDLISSFPVDSNGVELNQNGQISSSNNSDFVISAPLGVDVPKILTDDLEFSNTSIATTATNSSVNFNPTGRVNFSGTTNVTGNVFIDGNALYYTTTIFDPLPQSEVNAMPQDIRPSNNNEGSVGSAEFTWNQAFFKTVNATAINLPSLPSGLGEVYLGIPGNIIYVSTNGSDTRTGTIQLDPVRTIKHALSLATAGTTIYIAPGTYTEIFPLTIPAGVSVIGRSIRGVTIQPTAETIDQDAFLLNGENLVEDLTVANFRFNVANNTGYAFRFANNFTVTTKSPYIRNVSVITRGSNVTISDPLSYDTHDAGKGAYIDGSVANSASNQASMLFYGVTFITPGVDAITMTNGVRVECIDCFTYYANRGFYAIQGLEGFANQATVFGAELRSISCANVYGKYGIVGNGANVIAYLIGHNFAYVGTEKDSSNDYTLRVQANEVVEQNGASIKFNSTDQGGDYRIGDAFLVNFKKGTTSFSGENLDFSGISQITISSLDGNSVLAAYKVDSNNFRFSGSTIESISGNVNFVTATGKFTLNDNVVISKNLAVSGDVDFKGTIVVGNQTTDTVSFAMDLNQDIVPNVGDTYSLGSTTKRWTESYINAVNLPTLTINNDTITAIDSNLSFIGNGTAGVNVDGLTFTDNQLSAGTGVNVRFKPTTSNIVYIDSAASLRLPSGSSTDKPIMNSGEIRYDNVLNQFVGQKNFRTALGGVYSADRKTKIVAHPTNNTIPFVVNNNTVASVTTYGISTIGLTVDKISGSTNTLSTSDADNLILGNTGSSYVEFNNVRFDGDNIINTTNDVVTLPATRNSFTRLLNTTAVLIPVNDMASPDSMEVGTLRFNPTTGFVEVWSGDSFDNISGIGGNATEDDVEQLTNLWTLILG